MPGDLVCFDFNANGTADHIGICEDFDGSYVTTIDGNTGTTSEANGGAVMRRRRHKRYIVGVIRPAYESEDDREEEEDMDKDQVLKIIREYEENKKTEKPNPDWGSRGPCLGAGDRLDCRG